MKTEKINYSHSEETRLALLEQSINNINDTMVRFEKRFDKIDERFDKIGEKLDKIDAKIDANLKWILKIFLPIFLGMLGVMARGFHWI